MKRQSSLFLMVFLMLFSQKTLCFWGPISAVESLWVSMKAEIEQDVPDVTFDQFKGWYFEPYQEKTSSSCIAFLMNKMNQGAVEPG